MLIRRILARWIGDDAVAFALSNGRVIQVPAVDLDGLGRAALNAEVERLSRIAAAAEAQARPSTPATSAV